MDLVDDTVEGLSYMVGTIMPTFVVRLLHGGNDSLDRQCVFPSSTMRMKIACFSSVDCFVAVNRMTANILIDGRRR